MEAPVLVSAVSVLSALQMGYLARRVGWSREAHKIMPPVVSGPPEFERTFRAHQNCVEFYPIFLVCMWSCGVFFNEPIAAAGGLLYMIARLLYFNGYVKATKKRWPGFIMSVGLVAAMSLLGMIGIGQQILHKYFYVRS